MCVVIDWTKGSAAESASVSVVIQDFGDWCRLVKAATAAAMAGAPDSRANVVVRNSNAINPSRNFRTEPYLQQRFMVCRASHCLQ